MSNTELGAINSAPTGGVTPVEDSSYQQFNYTFTATQSQEYLSLLFRDDPGWTWLDTVAVVPAAAPAAPSVLVNGDFDDGGQPDNPLLPIGWSSIGTPGLANAGQLSTVATSPDSTGTPQSGADFWVDGTTQGYDGLAQQMTLTVGATYTLSFDLAVNLNGGQPDAGGPYPMVDTQVWVGADEQPAPLVPCFGRGTRILTDRGEIAVEDLFVGDLAVTASGQGDVLKPIVWLGRTPFDAGRHPRPDQVWPIRIRAGALGEGLPRHDLVVSPGHSLLLDGVLMQAARLVNGCTIVRDRATTRGEYFHIELTGHDILLSEGVPSESYLDTGNRGAFGRSATTIDLHPDFSPRAWTDTIVPLVQDGPRLEAVRRRLFERAQALGWQRSEDCEPQLVVDGAPVRATRREGGRVAFAVPGDARTIRLVSRFGSPAESLPGERDPRTLGLQVTGVAVTRGGVRRELTLDDPALAESWHGIESAANRSWRWTDGNALVAVGGACELEFSIDRAIAYWHKPATQPQEALALAG